uniref:Glycoside hydrolase n=2 Tax=Desertifilum TaxID=1185872 RepID=A0A1E5QR31_9CYAN|nr:glycoside hydrolase [Desertifilum tharense IPPAS B-1220]
MTNLVVTSAVVVGFMTLFWMTPRPRSDRSIPPAIESYNESLPQPLAMTGGDPHIRALMRTISASESNVRRPYSVLYGGQYLENLSRHPDRCIRIVAGPNTGNCTTAAGRYQFLTTTWHEQARRYHPQRTAMRLWHEYSFEAEYQDAVVYAWLKDSRVWGEDIPALLEQGKLDRVLRMLSGTWTSLGYGIETNSMSQYLPTIYQEVLQEELRSAS